MSTEGSEHFNQRVADVFGALDSHTPKHLSTSHKSSSEPYDRLSHCQGDLEEEPKDLPSKQHSPCDDGDERSHWRIRPSTAAADNGSQTRHRHHLETRSRPTARSPRHSRSNRVPDFLSNPAKWTKYDLKDDGTGNWKGLSEDQKNSHAAFQFLDELKERKHDVDTDDREGGAAVKVQFRKPRTPSKDHSHAKDTEHPPSAIHTEQSTTPSGSSHGTTAGHGVFKMAEYVVGSKAPQQRKQPRLSVMGEGDEDGERQTKKRKGVSAKAVVSLSHLEEEEEI